MTDDQRTLIEEGCAQLESRAGLIWGPEFIEEFAAALRALLAENAALKAERDEAHSLIRKWKVNLVEVVDDGEIMYAMTNDSMCNMTDSDKRAFLAATAKERGGA